MEAQAERPAVDLLVLARLLPAGDKGAALADLTKDLGPLLADCWTGSALEDRLQGTLDALETAGLVDRLAPPSPKARSKAKPKPTRHTLSAEGRREALRFLGLDAIPPKLTWAKIKKPYLLAQLLSVPATTRDAGFKSALLRSQYGLTVKAAATPKQVADALAWTLLGFDSYADKAFDSKALLAAILTRETDAPRLVDPKTVLDRMLVHKVGARNSKAAELFDAALRRWAAASEPAPSSPPRVEAAAPLVDLPTFARRVQEAARATSTGRFGDDEVFIAHVWRTLRDDLEFDAMDLAVFKRRLAEANNARLLDLSRADLVQAMDPDDVRESETAYYSATFHFVRIDGGIT